MTRRIEDAAVVVTGAGSGIGRAASRMLAERGASVIAVGRRVEPLDSLAHECRGLPGRIVTASADVRDEAAVDAVARRAAAELGRVDAWVNAAAVGAFARFEDLPSDVFRGVVDVVLHGTVNASRAAIRQFRERGHGTLVNVASTIGKAPVPLMSAYNAAKAGVVAFSETLRLEVEDDGIDVCIVNPPPTDTPFYANAANYTGHEARPPFPVYDARVPAEAVVRCIERPTREVNVGAASKLQQASLLVAPGPYEAIVPSYISAGMFTERDVGRTSGAVFESAPGRGAVAGGWHGRRAPLAPTAVGVSAALAGLGAFAWWKGDRDR